MITLVLGGARSGKSELAERTAAATGKPVTYLATAIVPEGDDDFAARIAAHRARRPADWTTVETAADLPAAVRAAAGATVLVESLGTWVAACDLEPDAPALCAALADHAGDAVVVSEEVGLGVHPATDAGRRFRDVLGDLNHRVADVADDVLLVIAGRALRLESVT